MSRARRLGLRGGILAWCMDWCCWLISFVYFWLYTCHFQLSPSNSQLIRQFCRLVSMMLCTISMKKYVCMKSSSQSEKPTRYLPYSFTPTNRPFQKYPGCLHLNAFQPKNRPFNRASYSHLSPLSTPRSNSHHSIYALSVIRHRIVSKVGQLC